MERKGALRLSGGKDGAFPIAGVVLGRAGSLYGAASLGGVDGADVVFELARPTSPCGSWTENVLYSFTDGEDGWSHSAA